jgi:RNA polymerase sigma factor (sigma-70 family)
MKIPVTVVAKAKNAYLYAFAQKCGKVKEAAERIGVHPSVYSAWMNFRDVPTGRNCGDKVVAALGLWVDEIGEDLDTIFPEIPPEVLSMLDKQRVVTKAVSLQQLESAVVQEQLTYESDVSARLDHLELREKLNEAMKLARLSRRESEIVKLRFYQEMLFSEIAKVFHISTARAQQVYSIAIRKLSRSTDVTAGLAEFMEAQDDGTAADVPPGQTDLDLRSPRGTDRTNRRD